MTIWGGGEGGGFPLTITCRHSDIPNTLSGEEQGGEGLTGSTYMMLRACSCSDRVRTSFTAGALLCSWCLPGSPWPPSACFCSIPTTRARSRPQRSCVRRISFFICALASLFGAGSIFFEALPVFTAVVADEDRQGDGPPPVCSMWLRFDTQDQNRGLKRRNEGDREEKLIFKPDRTKPGWSGSLTPTTL